MNLQKILESLNDGKRKNVILDTDAANEIDDQYAIGYALANPSLINLLSINAVPYFNDRSTSPEDGMIKSYEEIKKILNFMNLSAPVYMGSRTYITDDSLHRPVDSPAARNIIKTAHELKEPLYVLAIGAITNVVSAIMLDPSIKDNLIVLWLGGHEIGHEIIDECNLMHDYYAGQWIIDCGVNLILAPAFYVTSELEINYAQLLKLKGQGPLCDYLYSITNQAYEEEGSRPDWFRVIWDIAAIAPFTLPGSCKFEEITAPILQDNCTYAFDDSRHHIIIMKKLDFKAIINQCWNSLIGF